MIFLNPTILLGLFAATIPIIIHLLNLRKLKQVEFSSLNFLKELQKSKIRKIKIKQWLLLLLRTFIIIFLIMAFARPTLEKSNIILTGSSAKSSSVFILDNSFSMSYVNNEGSNLNKSKKAAKEIIAKMQNGDEIFILTISDSMKFTNDLNSANKLVDDIKISQLSKPLNKIVDEAIKLLLNSKNINKHIFLFSDLQETTFDVKTSDTTRINSQENKINFYAFDMSVEEYQNYSVSKLNLESQIIEKNKPIKFSAVISNLSSLPVNDVNASLFINGERFAQKNISLKAFEETKINFETTLNKSGLMEVSVILEDDKINYDNKAFTTFMIKDEINLLILYKNKNDIDYIESAFMSYSSSGKLKITNQQINNFVSSNLSLNDVIVMIGEPQANQLNILKNNIQSGGNLIYFPGSKSSINEINNFYSQFEMTSASDLIEIEPNSLSFAEFNFIYFNHPIFADLFSQKNKKEINSPKFYKYVKTFESTSLKPIIKLNDNSVFLGETNFKKGRILLFNSAPNVSWTNFPLKGIFAPLLNKSVSYLSSSDNKKKEYFTGEQILLNLKDLLLPNIKAVLPEGIYNINLTESQLKNNYNFNISDKAGIYKFYSNDKLMDFSSVNVNPIESNLKPIEGNVFESYLKQNFNNSYFILNTSDDFLKIINQARFGSELWKLFLIIALLLALIEMFIARNTKRDLLNLNNSK